MVAGSQRIFLFLPVHQVSLQCLQLCCSHHGLLFLIYPQKVPCNSNNTLFHYSFVLSPAQILVHIFGQISYMKFYSGSGGGRGNALCLVLFAQLRNILNCRKVFCIVEIYLLFLNHRRQKQIVHGHMRLALLVWRLCSRRSLPTFSKRGLNKPNF